MALWTFADLPASTLKNWWKPDALSTANGASITSIPDSSGNGYALTAGDDQSGGPGPVCVTNALNGKRVVALLPTAGSPVTYPFFSLNASALSGRTESATFWVSRNSQHPPSGQYNGAILGDWGTASDANHFPYVDNNIYEDYCSTTRRNAGTTPDMSVWHMFGLISKNGRWELWIDGSLFYADPDASNVFAANTAAFIGKSTNSGGATPYSGYWAEAGDCQLIPSQADIDRAFGYLAGKYALQANLPSGHAYRTNAPETAAGITGSSAITLGPIACTSAATIALKGSAAVTFGPITMASAGTAQIKGQAAIALGPIACASTATVRLNAASAMTLDPIGVSATGKALITGSASMTLGPIETTSAARAAITGTASCVLGPIVLSATGAGRSVNGGSAAIMLGPIGVSSSAQLSVRGDAALALGPITMSSAGATSVAGSAAIQMGPIAIASAATAKLRGQAAIQLGPIAMSATATNASVVYRPPHPSRIVHVRARRRFVAAPSRIRVVAIRECSAC